MSKPEAGKCEQIVQIALFLCFWEKKMEYEWNIFRKRWKLSAFPCAGCEVWSCSTLLKLTTISFRKRVAEAVWRSQYAIVAVLRCIYCGLNFFVCKMQIRICIQVPSCQLNCRKFVGALSPSQIKNNARNLQKRILKVVLSWARSMHVGNYQTDLIHIILIIGLNITIYGRSLKCLLGHKREKV